MLQYSFFKINFFLLLLLHDIVFRHKSVTETMTLFYHLANSHLNCSVAYVNCAVLHSCFIMPINKPFGFGYGKLLVDQYVHVYACVFLVGEAVVIAFSPVCPLQHRFTIPECLMSVAYS